MILSKINVTNKVGQFKTVSSLVLNVSFICDKTSPGKGGMIGTVHHNYHHPALIITFIFPDLLLKILRTSSQECACPTRTYACLIKHHSKQPIGTPRLNLVPAIPKLYKVAFHHVLVGIPTYKVLVLNSKESTTAYTAYTAHTTVLVDSKDHRHIVIGLIQ